MLGSNNNDNKYPHERLDSKTLEQLNAYLDGELNEAEQAQVRDLLRRSPAAANEMMTLKAASQALNELPPLPAPRSFALRPVMLEQPAQPRRGFTLFGWTPSPSFALSLGSVAAACLLVLVLVAQLASGGGPQNTVPAASSGQSGTTSQAYSNPRPNNAPSGAGGPAALAPTQPPPIVAMTSTAAMLVATPTTGETTMGAAIAPPSAATGGPAAGGASGASGGVPAPASPPTAFTNLKPQPTATSGGAGFTEGIGSAGNSPAAPGFSNNAPSGTAPTAAAPNDQANNSATSSGSINATGGVPDQNTNQTNNYNVSQAKGVDYWLIIEIALAVLTVALGLGALIVQRRGR